MTQVLKANHILGEIVLDEHGSIVEHPSRKSVPEVDQDSWPGVLKSLKNPKNFPLLREKNIERTRSQIHQAVHSDLLIMQAISAIDELDRAANLLSKRMREWSGWWVPELEKSVPDHAALARLIADGDKSSLCVEAKIAPDKSMGGDLSSLDIDALKAQAQSVRSLMAVRDHHEAYIKDAMAKVCPNLCALAGHLIGAKLMLQAGGLRHLSELPSSTIQILGAEKALFRHLRTGARPPKYGLIFNHPLVQSAKRQDQGKVARGLADKISIAVKVDFFKGDFIGQKLKDDLTKRFAR